MEAIEIKNLSKSYGDFALKDISFTVPKGAVTGLIGANGAGKTTIIKCILGMINYKGDIRVLGEDLKDSVKDRIGFLLEDVFISNYLNLNETDKIFSKIYSNWDSAYFKYLTSKFDLPNDKINQKFSKGMKMKYKIAIALSSKPELLIFDEPTGGLDPVVRSDILDIFLEFMEDENHSILLSSHITEDLEKIADYITYIDKGSLILSEEKYNLLESYGILKCSKDDLLKVPKEYILKYREEKYYLEALIKDKKLLKSKFPDLVIDNIGIDDIMVFYSKGENL